MSRAPILPIAHTEKMSEQEGVKEKMVAMNMKLIDLLDKAINKYIEPDKELLLAEGALTTDGGFIKSKLSYMTSAYSANLVDAIEYEDMNPWEVVIYIENLLERNQDMGVFYFLLCLFSALDMEVPQLYMQLPCHEGALRFYIGELIAATKIRIMEKIE